MRLLYALIIIVGLPLVAMASGTYMDFNNFPTTTVTPGGVPGNSTDTSPWVYSSGVTNNYPDNDESNHAGWLSTQDDGTHWLWMQDWAGSCYSHMGVETYGYYWITGEGHSGNALAHTITGGLPISDQSGACPNSPVGTPLFNLESYGGVEDIYTGGLMGHSYTYFHRVTTPGPTAQRVLTVYPEASDANRFSVYVYLPDGISNGVGGYNNGVQTTLQEGVFINSSSPTAHQYINYYVQGGGWAKMQVEETSNGTQSDSVNRYIPNMLKGDAGVNSTGVWQWYYTTLPYSGIATPPWTIKIDDIEFANDTYTPQNNETISNIAILYRSSNNTWEVSFNDKYLNAYAYSTYEVRYSLSGPITNENWGSATPVVVQTDARFYIQSRSDGKFQKWWPYYRGVWAPFKLTGTDTAALTAGQTVYFAVKDISQVNDTTTPTDGINGYWGTGKGGRDYATYPATFDWATDSAAIPYIKRISYTLASTGGTPVVNGLCGSSDGLSLAVAPTSGLCSAGTASAVSGDGPWSWTCAGSGGGTTDSCSASLLAIPTGDSAVLMIGPAMAEFR